MSATTSPLTLNCAPSFSGVYRFQQPGARRRQALLALFQQFPDSPLPVNNKWQANMKDPDLQQLVKKGMLVQFRDGGGRTHPLNKRSGKRQTYLALAPRAS